MASLDDERVRALLDGANFAVISTLNPDGSAHSTIVWISAEHDTVAVNGAIGRIWTANLERDPRVSVLVLESGDPYHFAEIRGSARVDRDDADRHIDRLAKKYTGEERFSRRPGEQRIKFVIEPDHVRHVRQ